MNFGTQELLMGKIAEEALCFLISYPLLGKLKKNRIWFFAATYAFWTIWSFARGLRVFTNNGTETTGRELFLQAVVLMIYFTCYGLATEGGIIRAVCNSLVQEISVIATTMCVEAALSLKRNSSFAQTYGSIDSAYTPGSIAGCFVLFLLLMFLLRKPLKRYRETPVENYLLVKILVVVFLLNAMSPFGYLLAVPGNAVRRAEDMTWYMLLSVIFMTFGFYHIREQRKQQQNRMLRQQNQMVKDHMAVFAEQIALTRKLRHDIRRHIQVLEWSRENSGDPESREQIDHYRNGLQQMYDRLRTGVYSGEADVDAILFSLEKYCRERGCPCRIRVTGTDWSGLAPGTGLSLTFYLNYWVRQSTQLFPEGTSVSVEITGGTVAGTSRLKALVSPAPSEDSPSGYLIQDILREMRSCLGGRGGAEVRREKDRTELAVYWNRDFVITCR